MVNIFWFRRDLRLDDNQGLFHALNSGLTVIPIFIFDSNILNELEDKNDRRVSFIHVALENMQNELVSKGCSLDVRYGNPVEVFKQLTDEYKIHTVFTNHDYEPYAKERDEKIRIQLVKKSITFKTFKDQVIFEKDEVVKDTGAPYSVFTPYSKKWLSLLTEDHLTSFKSSSLHKNFFKQNPKSVLSLEEIGFAKTNDIPSAELPEESLIKNYHDTRNQPSVETSRMGVHLRFGTISIRKLVKKALELNSTYLNELIWREFFMQMLWHQPGMIYASCKKEYENIQWRNDQNDFERWSNGETGYPIVDAGMRELNATGFMHNRVRMITAGFLVKHLLIDWRWGEAYFAKKLLDYELASNVGNWQWVAGCGCDAAPYFRIFNPTIQTKKFDPQLLYVRKWVKELDSFSYPKPIVDHEFARKRCLQVFKHALSVM